MGIQSKLKELGQLIIRLALFSCFLLCFEGGVYSRITPEPLQWTITLNISPTSVVFPPADPDLQPLIEASTPVSVQITTWPPNRSWALYIRAEGNLVSAEGNVLPINTVSWRAAPNPPFLNGVLVAGQNVLLAQSRGRREGEIVFYFQNSWDHLAGEYSQVVTFTASLI